MSITVIVPSDTTRLVVEIFVYVDIKSTMESVTTAMTVTKFSSSCVRSAVVNCPLVRYLFMSSSSGLDVVVCLIILVLGLELRISDVVSLVGETEVDSSITGVAGCVVIVVLCATVTLG